jgi:predicted TIM-barrel fold metal-dependent hydrolase
VSAPLVDVNVSLSRWPLRRLPEDETQRLASKLRAHGVESAWAGSFDGLLQKDIAGVNARLAEECRQAGGLLVPFGSVNPMLPDWEEDLRRCAEEHRMPGIRLHPGYHGYRLDSPHFARILQLAAERRLVVELVLAMEDERMMHPLLRAPAVDTAPLAPAVRQAPGVRLVILNGLGALPREPLPALLDAGEVYVEIAMLEGASGIARLLERVPHSRLLFGSHAPFFYFEAAILKLKESPITVEQLEAIGAGNARRVLSKER